MCIRDRPSMDTAKIPASTADNNLFLFIKSLPFFMSFPPFVVYTQISQWIYCYYTINICKKQVKSHFYCAFSPVFCVFIIFFYTLSVIDYFNMFSSAVFACAIASGIPAGFFPPACAIFGRPPPPPPTFPAIALIRLPAVSYTHLDVYKRQIHSR